MTHSEACVQCDGSGFIAIWDGDYADEDNCYCTSTLNRERLCGPCAIATAPAPPEQPPLRLRNLTGDRAGYLSAHLSGAHDVVHVPCQEKVAAEILGSVEVSFIGSLLRVNDIEHDCHCSTEGLSIVDIRRSRASVSTGS